MRKNFRKRVSVLCLLAMLVSLLPQAAFAAAPEQSVDKGINGFQASMQADNVTLDGWQEAFDATGIEGAESIDGTMRSSALNGKVWADKSAVVADPADKTFDVTLSALGQTFASTKTTTKEVAFDVVFVVDVSRSMNFGMSGDETPSDGDERRMAATVDALNSTADTLMDNANNRMAVVTFSSDASEMVGLRHYNKEGNRNYFSYEAPSNWGQGAGTLRFQAADVNKNADVYGGTNQQAGYFKAGDVLNGASLGSEPVHIPVVIMLTDGTPDGGGVSSYYKEGQRGDGSAKADNVASADHYYSICTAAYKKDQISAHYKNQPNVDSVDTAARFYTIGLGLSAGSGGNASDDAIMLDPSKRDMDASNDGWGRDSLSGTINDNSADKMGFSTYDYADKSWVNASMSSDELDQIFDEIIGDISDITGGADVGESTGGRNKMSFFETLGDGVAFTGEASLSVPTYTVEKNVFTKGETRHYSFHFEATNKVGDVNPGDTITADNGPAYIKGGGIAIAVADKVRVGDGGEQDLDPQNTYDEAVMNREKLVIKVSQQDSGKRQMEYHIPSELMAYNVLTEVDGEKGYFEIGEPVQLRYGVQMRDDVDTAGSYLIGEPGQTYMHFNPSSAQDEDGNYLMPYYWPGGQFERDSHETAKTDGVPGADSYVNKTQKGGNNDVYTYLGNNGLYTLDGKQLTFHLFWDDANNQDGQRFENVTVQLYREAVAGDSTDAPTEPPKGADKFGEPVTLGISNVVGDDPNQWKYTTGELPVYDENGQVYRYWLKFVTDEGSDDRGYTGAINDGEGHSYGYMLEGGWFCFAVEQGLLADGRLGVKLSRTPETVAYTVEKKWDSSTGDAENTENSVSVQLYANGQKADVDGNIGDSAQPFVITRDEDWTKTLTLPKYHNGEPVTYHFVEQGEKYTPIVKQNGKTVTITNYSSLDTTSLTAVKQWRDSNNQDGKRPESVALKLTATVGGAPLDDEKLAALLGQDVSVLTQTVKAENAWTATWDKLPKESEGQAMTYSATEVTVPDGYECSASEGTIPNYVFLTNKRTPETTSVTIAKVWDDEEDKDGLRPDAIHGSLYKQVGDAQQLIELQTYTVDASGQTVLDNLPSYESGKAVHYYISEDAVKGYETSADHEAVEIGGKTVYPVTDGKVTLTNSHTPVTTDYTVSYSYEGVDDETAYPSSLMLMLVASDGSSDPQYFSLTVQLNEDGTVKEVIFPMEGKPGEEHRPPLLEDATYEPAEDGHGFVIKGLRTYQNGQTVSYMMTPNVGITDNTGFTVVNAVAGYDSMSFGLKYTPSPRDLGFTKVWAGDDPAGRPSADEYGDYLTLHADSADGEIVREMPTVTDNGDNTYTVTYKGLPAEGDFVVVEKAVPNYSADRTSVPLTKDSSNRITNTYAQEVYDEVTVTKVWKDADGADKRPAAPSDAADDPLALRLYPEGAEMTAETGLAPSAIAVDGDRWTYTFTDVPKLAADGSKLQYIAHENTVPDGYSVNGDVKVIDGLAEGEIVNTLDGGAVATGNLTVTKTWKNDADFTDKRTRVELEVLADKTTIVDTITMTQTADGVTATHKGGAIDVTADGDSWSVTLKGLAVSAGGNAIQYSLRELEKPDGYAGKASAPVTLESGKTATLSVTNTYTPDSWRLTYNAAGGSTDIVDDTNYTAAHNTATIKDGTTTYEGHLLLGWTTSLHGVVTDAADVPADDDVYTVGEKLTMNGATTLYALWAVDENGDKTPDYDQIDDVTVKVIWKDDGNRCGIRPTDVDFTLKEGEYRIDLADPQGVRVYTNDGNTEWIYTVPDVFDKDTVFAPEELQLTVEAGAHADPKDEAGYDVGAPSYDAERHTYTVEVSHTPETVRHDVTKRWDFNDADYSIGEATVALLADGQPATYADGSKVEALTFEPKGEEDLYWDNLPKYEGGNLITYHAVEEKVIDAEAQDVTAHFSVDYDWTDRNHSVLTNTYDETRTINLLYTWNDDNDSNGTRPQSVTVQLFNADTNEPIGEAQTISDAERWQVTWNDLPIYDDAVNPEPPTDGDGDEQPPTDEGNGDEQPPTVEPLTASAGNETPINYTVKVVRYVDANDETVTVDLGEDAGDDATLGDTAYSFDEMSFGADSLFVMESALEDKAGSVTVDKAWNDANNQYGTRPESIIVNLLQDGKVYQSAEVKAADGWTYTWNDVPLVENGVTHTYSVSEMPVASYTMEGNAQNDDGSWTITNKLNGLDGYDDEFTLTFVYDHASASHGDTAIDENTPITVTRGDSYAFSAKAEDGYILKTPSLSGSARLVSDGGDAFTVEDIQGNVTVTISAEKKDDGGGGIIIPPDKPDKPELERGDHYAYIVGYEDETIRPQNAITRAEVATIFFRLLTQDSREVYFTTENDFSDVPPDAWYGNTVSTLANAGILSGYPDGSFRPDAPITRAEFAAIATRFDDLPVGEDSRLTDIDGHWAEDAINAAYNAGWVGGYPDGSFRPDQNITRAEVMSLVNRVLNRAVKPEGMLDEMRTWSDCAPSDWFYEDVQEATNSHDYDREDGEKYETWTAINEPPDWDAIEDALLNGSK